jgi:transcriptional regulator of arginine metabolism
MQSQPKPTDAREARHQRILQLLGRRTVRRHRELQALLQGAGFPVNQATLSRDLRELGIVKGRDGYELPAAPALPADSSTASLWHAVRAFLRTATAAQNLVVLQTPAGGAQALALACDRAADDGLLAAIGTIAGDDTVLVVCKDGARARAFARRLLRIRDTQSVVPASSA